MNRECIESGWSLNCLCRLDHVRKESGSVIGSAPPIEPVLGLCFKLGVGSRVIGDLTHFEPLPLGEELEVLQRVDVVLVRGQRGGERERRCFVW